jgi:hypothetical protein
MSMLTKTQIEEARDEVLAEEQHGWDFIFDPNVDSWFSDISKEDRDLIVSIIGNEFINIPFDKWGKKEHDQMQILLYISACILKL